MSAKYVATPREQEIINQANAAFLSRYFVGLALGGLFTYGALKLQKIRLRSIQGGITAFGIILSTEFMGRKVGETQAIEVLSRLPDDSPLKQALDKFTKKPSGGDTALTPNVFGSQATPVAGFGGNTENKNVKRNSYGDIIEE